LAERVGVIEIDLPDGVRVRVDQRRQREGAAAGAVGSEGAGMIGLAPGTKVFLACQPIDLRAGFIERMRAAPERMISAARGKFAADSLLEGIGFETSVPREEKWSIAKFQRSDPGRSNTDFGRSC
jgi:hypothetical protein